MGELDHGKARHQCLERRGFSNNESKVHCGHPLGAQAWRDLARGAVYAEVQGKVCVMVRSLVQGEVHGIATSEFR
jgi:hypothetical protein